MNLELRIMVWQCSWKIAQLRAKLLVLRVVRQAVLQLDRI